MLSHDPTYPLFPTMAFLGFVVSLIPLPWHIHAWNSGTCAYMLWTATACLLSFINSLVWKGNAINFAPVWCDISSKLLLGVGIGIPASGLCISRRLYKITSMRTVSISRRDKLNAIAVDLAIAVGIPILVMILHVVVQPHRFDILEDVGCYAVVYITLPAYFLFFMWPLVLGSISFVYSALCLRAFYIRRLQFAQILAHNKSLDASRYMRLMLLAIMDMCCTIPFGALSIYLGTHNVEAAPWISWADTHYDFGHIDQIPAIIWRSNSSYERSVEMTRWLPVACAFLFFGLFGFASEARRYYGECFATVLRKLGRAPNPKLRAFKIAPPKWDNKPSAGSLPVYAPNKESSDRFASKKNAFNSTSDTFASTTAANSSMDFDPEKGIPLPSSPATTAPPEYEYHERDLPDLPVHVIPPSPPSSDSSSPSSSRRSSTDIEHREFSFHRLPSRSILGGPSTSSLHSQSLPSLRAAPPPMPTPQPATLHAPHHTRSQSSLRSLATSLASSTGGQDVIYIYDAYGDSPSPSPPPFSNLTPTTAQPEMRQSRRATPLFIGRRAHSPSPVRVTVSTEHEAFEA